MTEGEVVLDNQASYTSSIDWVWTTTTETTIPITPIKAATFGGTATARDYSVAVAPGSVTPPTGSVVVDKAPANAFLAAKRTHKFEAPASGVYSVWFDHHWDLTLPAFPWDARHDVGELSITMVVGVRTGAAWDPKFHPKGNFVVEVDVGAVLDQVVGKVSNIYLSQPNMVAYFRAAGLLLREAGTIKIGVHWNWNWHEGFAKRMGFDVTFISSFRTFARQILFALATGDEDSSTAGGQESWELVCVGQSSPD